MKKKIKIKKNITLEDLALMTARGFEELSKEMNLRFVEVNNRFDRLEKILILDHKNRIERLEDQVKELQADFRQLLGFKK
jgi:hypothetical protein